MVLKRNFVFVLAVAAILTLVACGLPLSGHASRHKKTLVGNFHKAVGYPSAPALGVVQHEDGVVVPKQHRYDFNTWARPRRDGSISIPSSSRNNLQASNSELPKSNSEAFELDEKTFKAWQAAKLKSWRRKRNLLIGLPTVASLLTTGYYVIMHPWGVLPDFVIKVLQPGVTDTAVILQGQIEQRASGSYDYRLEYRPLDDVTKDAPPELAETWQPLTDSASLTKQHQFREIIQLGQKFQPGSAYQVRVAVYQSGKSSSEDRVATGLAVDIFTTELPHVRQLPVERANFLDTSVRIKALVHSKDLGACFYVSLRLVDRSADSGQESECVPIDWIGDRLVSVSLKDLQPGTTYRSTVHVVRIQNHSIGLVSGPQTIRIAAVEYPKVPLDYATALHPDVGQQQTERSAADSHEPSARDLPFVEMTESLNKNQIVPVLPHVAVVSKQVNAKGGQAKLRLSCKTVQGQTCRGRLKLTTVNSILAERSKGNRKSMRLTDLMKRRPAYELYPIGSANFVVPAGKTVDVVVHLNSHSKRILVRNSKLSTKIRIYSEGSQLLQSGPRRITLTAV